MSELSRFARRRHSAAPSVGEVEERTRWQLTAGAVAVVLVVFLAARALGGSEPPRSAVRIDRGGVAGARAGPGATKEGRGRVYVHVAGEVRRPGLLALPDGSRIAVAILRAGGPTGRAEMAAINLAQRVIDGQQVLVPRIGAAPIAAATGSPAGAAGAVEAPISLATATQEQLEELDGIGPTLAERIIELRDESGGFRSIDQLQEVEGIGEKRFAALKEAVVP